MFGLDTIKVAVVAGLITASLGCAYAVYHGIQASAVAKVELQQAKLAAAAQHAQDQRNIEGLQQSADLATTLAAQVTQLKEAINAAPVSRECLASPAGHAFSLWLRNHGGLAPAPGKAAAGPLAVPGSATHSR